MDTKLAVLKRHVDAGEYRDAVKLAASFPRLGDHADVIRRGWAAASQPGNYRAMGYDPDACLADAVKAIRERYNIPEKKDA